MVFYPRVTAIGKNGNFKGIYIIENVPSLGSLGGAFGYYKDAKLHFLRWDGLALQKDASTDSLGGYAADFATILSNDGQVRELWVAIVGAGSRTSVLKLQP
jgi:hypothetical protein